MDTTVSFLKPRLTGGRFEDHAIPLEFLKDLAVLEEMIVEVAKWKYLKDHGDRKRTPRGFSKGIHLKLTGVEDGSTIPIICLFFAANALIPPESSTYFERARDSVICAIHAAEDDQQITEHLPEDALSYFDRFGRNLREDEAIEFTIPDQQRSARLTRGIRRKLVLASSRVSQVTEDISIRGTVPEADQDNMSFQIQLINGRKICAPIAAQHFETIKEAFSGYKSGLRILLHGIGKFDRNEKLLSLESVETVSILDNLDVPTRLEELQLLKNGWLEGEGIAPSKEGLQWLSTTFGDYFPDDLQLPYIYPTPEGGIQAEWSLQTTEVTIEIDLNHHSGQWHSLNMDTDVDESKDLNLDKPEEWEWLIAKIQQLIGGTQ